MSAVPQLPLNWDAGSRNLVSPESACDGANPASLAAMSESPERPGGQATATSVAFLRKHTENTLRRYLYASMQVGRTPSILGDPVGRGWVSSRTVRTFEDALIFVLDVERCLEQLDPFQRLILSRIVLQDYTQAEAAGMLGMAPRTAGYKLSQALDCLTEKLLASDLLLIPE